MKRVAAYICMFLCAALAPAAALAQSKPAPQSLRLKSITGKVVYAGNSALTIQTGGRMRGVIAALTASASALSARDLPYVWGGGHDEAGVPSVGISGGPGYNGHRRGYDCSGAVAAVLAGGGLWPPGSGVPNDFGVIQQLAAERLIARGAATTANGVTLYDDKDVHIFMNIDGRFFGTSDGAGGGNAKGGPAWLYDGAPDAQRHVFRRYHFLPSVLRDRTSYGHDYTFETGTYPNLAEGAEIGDKVKVTYKQLATGALVATSIEWSGSRTVNGTVSSIAPGGGSVTVVPAGGSSLSFSTSAESDLISGLEVGDGVQVSYTKDRKGRLIPHTLTIVSGPSG